MMEYWILLWKTIFIVTIVAFSVMAVWVTIGGYIDIKKLFTRLNETHSKSRESS